MRRHLNFVVLSNYKDKLNYGFIYVIKKVAPLDLRVGVSACSLRATPFPLLTAR